MTPPSDPTGPADTGDRSTDTADRSTDTVDRSTDTADRSTDTADRSTDTADRTGDAGTGAEPGGGDGAGPRTDADPGAGVDSREGADPRNGGTERDGHDTSGSGAAAGTGGHPDPGRDHGVAVTDGGTERDGEGDDGDDTSGDDDSGAGLDLDLDVKSGFDFDFDFEDREGDTTGGAVRISVDDIDEDDAAFDRLTEFIESEMDFATSHYNDSYLKRRFASRMRRLGVTDYDDYREELLADPDERRALLDALSINVTGFFRNEDVWEGIRTVLRRLSANREALSVWSAGCADGREPYSVAMLALADPKVDADVSVVGTDINNTALERAREGVYRSSKTVDIDDQLSFLSEYRRFVDRDGDSFRVTDPVREAVSFEHHDLINDEPKSGFELVLCRNLFIYIDGEYKVPVLSAVREGMVHGGYLVIGKAETVPAELRDAFAVEDGPLRIYRRA